MSNYFEGFADEYADEIMSVQPEFYAHAAEKINSVLEGLDKGNRVLDVGNGGVINYDTKLIGQLTCVDLYIIRQAVERYQQDRHIRFMQGNMLELKEFAEEEFDAVIIQTVIHHLAEKTLSKTEENVEKGIRECMRVLKKDGYLLIVESTVTPWFELLERRFYGALQLFFRMIHFDTVYQYSPKRLLRKLQDMDLHVMENEEIKIGKYIWLCRKKIVTAFTPCSAHWYLIKK